MKQPVSDVFSCLTAEHVLTAVEACGLQCTGRTLQLNSMENRVYAVELDSDEKVRTQVVVKFYRPGRWTADQIMSEHSLQIVLSAEDIPTPETFDVLTESMKAPIQHGLLDLIVPREREKFRERCPVGILDGYFFCVWKKSRGRTPLELSIPNARSLGAQIGRMHNLFDSSIEPTRFDRPVLSTDRLGVQQLIALENSGLVNDTWARSLFPLCENLIEGLRWFDDCMEFVPIHGDLHRLNLLDDEGKAFWVVDFDDCVWGPEVQDLWLMASGCALLDCPEEIDPMQILLEGYAQVRDLPENSLLLVEPLRTLRMIYYWGWIASRYKIDPKFKDVFSFFPETSTWEKALYDMEVQKEKLLEHGLLQW